MVWALKTSGKETLAGRAKHLTETLLGYPTHRLRVWTGHKQGREKGKKKKEKRKRIVTFLLSVLLDKKEERLGQKL